MLGITTKMKKLRLILLAILFPILLHADNVTPNFINLGPSTSGTIPTNSRGWTIAITAGTAVIAGQSVQAGFSDSSPNQTTAPIVVTTNVGSIAYIRYNQ